MSNVQRPAPDLPVDEPSVNGSGPAEKPAEVTYDPLKLQNLRSKSGVLKGLRALPSRVPIVHRPDAGDFFRIGRGDEYTEIIDLLECTTASNSGDRHALYVVTDDARYLLERFIKPHRVAIGINRQKVVFLWARAAGAGDNSWTESVWRAWELAKTSWVTLESDMPHSEYKVHYAEADQEWGDPDWPNQTLEEVIGQAFRDRVIASIDDPVAQRLRGVID
jgi:hypothetical protein